jgi:hypothetical protein
MTAKEYLNQVRYADQSINVKLEQLALLHDLATRTTTVYSDMPHGQPDHTSTQKIVCNMIELEKEIAGEVNKLVALKLATYKTLDRIGDTATRLILEYRYLSFKKWGEIATLLNICIRDVYRLHGDGLEKVCEILKIGSKSH